MLKYFNTLTNERGDVLPNYRLQVVDSAGSVVTIYEDKSGTRFTDASGNNVNYATAESDGRAAFYWTPAEGQILQTLDVSGNLIKSEADFADGMVLDTLPGTIAQSAVTDLVSDLAAKAETADLASKVEATDLAASGGAALVGTSYGLNVEQIISGQFPRPEWFGGAADYNVGAATGTDNAAAINACLTAFGVCYLRGNYGVASPITVGQGQSLISSGIGTATVTALPTFAGAALVTASATRATVQGIIATLPTATFDPSVTTIDCFATSGEFYHQYFIACRALGGRRGFSLGSLEAKMWGCHAQFNYDGFYVTGFDTTFMNVSATDNVNYGVYSEAGLQGCDIHVVRAGYACLYLFNQVPVNISTIHIDTPTRFGIMFVQTRGATLDGVFFTKAGEFRGSPSDFDVVYLNFTNSRGNSIKGGAIQIQNSASSIDTTGHYFIGMADSADDSLRSINNTFENWRGQTITPIKANVANEEVLRSNRFVNNTGLLGKHNNEGLLYRSDNISLAASATTTLKMWLPEIDTANGSRMAVLAGKFIMRGATSADWATGDVYVRIAPSGATTGVVTVAGSNGTAPTFTITNVAYNTTTRVLTFTVTNTGAANLVGAISLQPPLDNQGM